MNSAPKRPARCHRFQIGTTLVDIQRRIFEYQFGDVLLIDYSHVAELCFRYIVFNCTTFIDTANWNLVGPPMNLLIDKSVTDAFPDAFLHYQEMIEETHQLSPHIVISMMVSSRDLGIARIFNANERSQEIYRRWKKISIIARPDCCGILDADFGNGLNHLSFSTEFEPTILFKNHPHSSISLATLDATIKVFEESQETLIVGFIIINDDTNDLHEEYYHKICKGLPSGWSTELSTHIAIGKRYSRVIRVCGPAQGFVRKESRKNFEENIAVLLAQLDWQFGSPRFKDFILEGDKKATPRLVGCNPFPVFWDFLQNRFAGMKSRSFWSEPEYQWRDIHRRILEFGLLFSSFNLPPYVQLEILDWWPQCYMSRHIWKIRLIEGIIQSVRKVWRQRGLFETRSGRLTRPRYVVQRIKL